MRGIVVGVTVAVMMMAGAALGDMHDGAGPCVPETGGAVHFANPTTQVVHEEYHSGAAEFGLALASTTLSLIYNPFRLAYGIVGAELGGFGGWATGGDLRTAKGLWRPTVEGHYYIRPDHLDGTEGFRFNGTEPIRQRVSVTVREPVTSSDSVTVGSDAGAAEEATEPAEPEPGDDYGNHEPQ